MRPSQRVLKASVLFLFIFLIIGFVAYRSGTLVELFSRKKHLIIPGHPATNEMNLANTSNAIFEDNLPASLPDSTFIIISSSKSIIVTQPTFKLSDSLLSKLKIRIPDSPVKKKIIMSSSKSSTIFKPRTNPPYKTDTSRRKQ